MKFRGLKKPSMLGPALFASIAVGMAAMLVFVGRYLYSLSDKAGPEYYAKLGELTLQLAVVVIIGTLLTLILEWGASQRARDLKKREDQKEFLRRVRAMHVTIQYANDLMNAHLSPRTWGKQSRRLIRLRSEVEEIVEDLKASDGLFKRQPAIVDGLEAIISYLGDARKEYVDSHSAIDSGYKAGEGFSETIDKKKMSWTRDFIARGEIFQNRYEANLTRSKGAMRKEVYGVWPEHNVESTAAAQRLPIA